MVLDAHRCFDPLEAVGPEEAGNTIPHTDAKPGMFETVPLDDHPNIHHRSVVMLQGVVMHMLPDGRCPAAWSASEPRRGPAVQASGGAVERMWRMSSGYSLRTLVSACGRRAKACSSITLARLKAA